MEALGRVIGKRMAKVHLRAYKGSHLTVCGLDSKGRVGLFATCKTCALFDGKVPPANYADLMGYTDPEPRGTLKPEEFSSQNEEELIKEQSRTKTRDISYEEYKFLDHLDRRAVNPAKVQSDRSRIYHDAVEFNFGKTKKIPVLDIKPQKKI